MLSHWVETSMKLQRIAVGVLFTVPVGYFLKTFNSQNELTIGWETVKQVKVFGLNKAREDGIRNTLNHNLGLESATGLILVSIPRFLGMGNHLGPLSDT